MEIIEMKTATITQKGQIVIPKEIRSLEQFKVGSKVAIITFEDHIEIRPLKEFNAKYYPFYASYDSLSKHWNTKEEDEAWKNL